MSCNNCNKEGDEFDNYCRQCGEPTGREYFECDCGAEVEKDDLFCHDCGTKFEGVEEDPDDEGDDTEEESETGETVTAQPGLSGFQN